MTTKATIISAAVITLLTIVAIQLFAKMYSTYEHVIPETRERQATTVETPSHNEMWLVIEDGFMSGCTSEGANWQYCSCAYNSYIDGKTLEETISIMWESSESEELTEDDMRALTSCLRYY